jgi:hypothetical protein
MTIDCGGRATPAERASLDLSAIAARMQCVSRELFGGGKDANEQVGPQFYRGIGHLYGHHDLRCPSG